MGGPPRSGAPGLASQVAELARRQDVELAEIYAKRGRSRHFEIHVHGETVGFGNEAGWAARGGDEKRSFFCAATGAPDLEIDWPKPSAGGLSLPEGGAVRGWREPSDFDAPLLGEREGLELLRGVAKALSAELPGAKLLSAVLDDGASESELANSRGVEVRWRSRVAVLEAEAMDAEGRSAAVQAAARHGREIDVPTLARRLAHALALAGAPPLAEALRGAAVLAPAVGARLLLGLRPLLVGSAAEELAVGASDGEGRVAAPAFSVVDDGRLRGGVMTAPVDGEGVPTAEIVLIDEGHYRQPLLDWRADGSGGLTSGCSRRASWKDRPQPGPTHLYIRHDPQRSAASMVKDLEEGFYLFDAPALGAFDLAADRFRLPVRGFAMDGGRPRREIAGAVLQGSISELLWSVQAVARDLSFLPLDGMIGAPSLLLGVVELAPRSPAAPGDAADEG